MRFVIVCLAAFAFVACEQKPKPAAEPAAKKQHKHIDTNRKGFQAAGKAAKQIEQQGADRNSAADDAMKAGQ